MPLSIGDLLGPYQVLAPIGAGGMGEVYKARDTRLDRVVAIKVSKEQFSERFEREARAVAALNHPHICQLYDVGPNYLVMEFIEGVPLKGPLPIDKAVEYAGQILDALDAAHKKSITHRDLKPANILVSKQGIKLLDFGLAKRTTPLKETDATLTAALTSEGQIVGTLQYMSPEQLQSKDADARSDIFAFGCVLYELLTGKRAFEGSNAASVIAAILEREPAPLTAAPPLERVVRRALAKDPDQRFQTARDLKAAMLWAIEQPVASIAAKPGQRWKWTAAALLLAFATLAVIHFREKPSEVPVTRSSLLPPEETEYDFTFPTAPALSPDGTRTAFGAKGKDGRTQLWLREIASGSVQPLAGTEGANRPSWSPDSRWIAFSQGLKLKKISSQGGPPLPIADIQNSIRGGSWNSEGVILFSVAGNGLYRVPASGGTSSSLVNASGLSPWFLPDGRHFLYTTSDPGDSAVMAASLDEPEKPGKAVANAQSTVMYAQGHLLYIREDTLYSRGHFAGAALRCEAFANQRRSNAGGVRRAYSYRKLADRRGHCFHERRAGS